MRHSAQTLSNASKRPFIAAAMACALAACAGSESDFTGADGLAEAASESLAVVALTWRTTDGNRYAAANTVPVQGPTGLAQVYVIDYAPGKRSAALELLSLPAAALVLDMSLGVGECRVDGARSDAGQILLRDAGEIAVEGDMGVSVLDSSWLPEGSLDVSGVAYTGLLGPRSKGPRKTIQVLADGSPEVGPFTVQLTPPPAVKLLSVGSHDVARGRVQMGDSELMQQLDIAWESNEAPAPDGTDGESLAGPASSDLTVVVFERRTFGATWTISCVADDDGQFTIPAGALMSLPDVGPDRTDSVTVRRIASASFSARHVPEGMALAVSEDQAYVE